MALGFIYVRENVACDFAKTLKTNIQEHNFNCFQSTKITYNVGLPPKLSVTLKFCQIKFCRRCQLPRLQEGKCRSSIRNGSNGKGKLLNYVKTTMLQNLACHQFLDKFEVLKEHAIEHCASELQSTMSFGTTT